MIIKKFKVKHNLLLVIYKAEPLDSYYVLGIDFDNLTDFASVYATLREDTR